MYRYLKSGDSVGMFDHRLDDEIRINMSHCTVHVALTLYERSRRMGLITSYFLGFVPNSSKLNKR